MSHRISLNLIGQEQMVVTSRDARGEVGPPTVVADNTKAAPWFIHTGLSGEVEEVVSAVHHP